MDEQHGRDNYAASADNDENAPRTTKQRRRRWQLVASALMMHALQMQLFFLRTKFREREEWGRDRSIFWAAVDMFSPAQFKHMFHVTIATYDFLVEQLKPYLERPSSLGRRAAPARFQLLVGLWRLATRDSLKRIAIQFGIALSTAHAIIHNVCRCCYDYYLFICHAYTSLYSFAMHTQAVVRPDQFCDHFNENSVLFCRCCCAVVIGVQANDGTA
jgi:hypothetical protein